MIQNSMNQLLRTAFWGEEPPVVTRETFEKMKEHHVCALAAPALSKVSLPDDLRREWKIEVIKQVNIYNQYLHAQNDLPITVPYVILKGTAAGQYYPYPEYRRMGDIDLMTRREDYEAACSEMLQNGFTELTLSEEDGDFGRHRSFYKNGTEVEIHAFFALLNDVSKAKYLDDLIVDSIQDCHFLPDPVNGLVLLEHIAQHMEEGLGLRRIIDWMLFVHRCLPDEKWPEFQLHTEKTGLTTFAITVTRMCEIYLGLPERKWCAGADERRCEQLMEYVSAYNDDSEQHDQNEGVARNVFVYARTPANFFRILQGRGLANWKAAREHKCLRPFAWLYQANRYFFRGVKQSHAAGKLKAEFHEAKERKDLFDSLGVQQSSKGFTKYENGEYVIRDKQFVLKSILLTEDEQSKEEK